MSRRKLLTGAGQATAAGSGTTDHPDAELLRLGAEWQAAQQRLAAFDQQHAGAWTKALERERGKMQKTADRLLPAIGKQPAASVAGMKVKAQALAEWYAGRPRDAGERLLASLVKDMARLPEGGAS